MLRIMGGGLLGAAALGLWPGLPAQAQDPSTSAIIEFVPENEHPPIPAGLQLVCMPVSGEGAPPSGTCPVVRYRGVNTWAYSYADNRMALALVSYDADNKVLRTTESGGARYLFNATVSYPNQTVTFIGQAEQFVTVPWSVLGPAQ